MRPVDMLAAAITATLAGTGVGGGGLFVIYLTAMGLCSQRDAQALNLVFFISAAVAALPFHLKRHKIPLKRVLLIILLGCVGTLIGGFIRRILPENALRGVFGVMLIATGLTTFMRKKAKINQNFVDTGSRQS